MRKYPKDKKFLNIILFVYFIFCRLNSKHKLESAKTLLPIVEQPKIPWPANQNMTWHFSYKVLHTS